jgi:hypothetical protein
MAPLLVTRCGLSPDAADATLLDLAARRILELHQPGEDPADLLVRVRVPAPEGLTSHERPGVRPGHDRRRRTLRAIEGSAPGVRGGWPQLVQALPARPAR